MRNNEMNERIEKRNERTPLETVVPLKAPYIMHIDPCGACNFKCQFCPCNISDFETKERHKKMSLELFKKIVDGMQLFEEKVKVVNLYAFGEPLLNPYVPDMVKYLKEKKVCNEIRITTNGYCLSPELNSKLIDSGVDLVRISVEALTEEDYTKICGVEKINLKQYINNIGDLWRKSRGSQTKIAVKIVNSMIQNEEDEQLFFDTYSKYADYVFRENVDNIWSEFDIDDVAKNNKTRFEVETAMKCVTEKEKCAYPLISMVVHSNGVVSSCCVDWKFATAYGDVTQSSIYDIWHSGELRQFQIGHMEVGREINGFCSTCIYKSFDKVDNVADVIATRLKEEMS